jgi:hypothetical protein
MAALSVSSRRLPGMSRRVAMLWAVVFPQQKRCIPEQNGAMGKTLRWVIPGSRLLLTDRAANL